jgi:hypothetical protein
MSAPLASSPRAPEAAAELLHDALAAPPAPAHLEGVVLGTLAALPTPDAPHVEFCGNPEPRPLVALTTAHLTTDHLGKRVALLFRGGDPRQPVLVGVLRDAPELPALAPAPLIARVDGVRTEITANHEIVLRCGRASITLTHAGKIILRGRHILSRATGANRVQGATVQLN